MNRYTPTEDEAIAINYVLDRINGDLNRAPYAPFRIELAGSVEKNTFNEGISDIDLRAVTTNSALLDYSPKVAKRLIMKQIRSIDEVKNPRVGHQAVTLIKGGHEYQIIPVIRHNGKTYIPSERGTYWKTVDIEAFNHSLHSLNRKTNGHFCEAVRFVKILSDRYVPKRNQLSGYHIESIAMEAIGNCSPTMGRTDMVEKILRYIPSRVKSYSWDITRETKAIDHDLGSNYSAERKDAAKRYHRLKDMFARLRKTKDDSILDEL